MKKIKKSIFGIGLALAMIMGIGVGFSPQKVNAEQNDWCIYQAFTEYDFEFGGFATICPVYIPVTDICYIPCIPDA